MIVLFWKEKNTINFVFNFRMFYHYKNHLPFKILTNVLFKHLFRRNGLKIEKFVLFFLQPKILATK